MKERTSVLKHTLKGELQKMKADVLTVIKKEDEDSVNFSQFFEDVKKFVEANEGKYADIQFVLKASE